MKGKRNVKVEEKDYPNDNKYLNEKLTQFNPKIEQNKENKKYYSNNNK